MTNSDKDLLLDPDGIPILTNLVQEDAAPYAADPGQETSASDVSVDDLAALLLKNNTFRQQLDEIAAELTHSVREQTERALKPVLEEAVSLALDDSTKASCEAIRERLKATLPRLLARTLQD